MSKATVNYIDTYFEFKELTKIHGEPTYDSIKRLHNEVKANAASVPSTLGGGVFGHLGLVLTPNQYAMVSNAPFNRPNHPGQCIIPQNSTQAQIQAIRDTHTEQLRVFNEVLGVEAALRQQINDAVEDSYLKSIRNRQTNAIIMPVSDIFHLHLYPNYGEVDSFKLEEEREKVMQMTYDTAYPPDMVYETIEDLMDMATASGVPFTQHQAVNMAIVIINKTGLFKDDMRTWLQTPPLQRTWIAFKRHFTEAYKLFKQLNTMGVGPAMAQQSANAIKQMIFAAVQELAQEQVPEPSPPVHQAPPPPTVQNGMIYQPPLCPPVQPMPYDHTANATIMNNNQQLQQQVRDLTAMVQSMQNNSQVFQGQPHAGRRAGRRPLKPWKYCHTHGYCKHAGSECRYKGPDHKDEATLFDNMGGSDKGKEKWQRSLENNN